MAVCTVNECIERGEKPKRAAAIVSAADSTGPGAPPPVEAPFVGVALLSVVVAEVDSDDAEEGVRSWMKVVGEPAGPGVPGGPNNDISATG